MASPFYLYGTKRLCTEKKKMPEYSIGILRLVRMFLTNLNFTLESG